MPHSEKKIVLSHSLAAVEFMTWKIKEMGSTYNRNLYSKREL